ncbi:hypothetical protein D3C75_509120 [compost metagenome]
MIRCGAIVGVYLIGNKRNVHCRVCSFVGNELIGKLPADLRELLVFVGVIIEQEQINNEKLSGFLDNLQNSRQNLLLPSPVCAAVLISKIMPELNVSNLIHGTFIGNARGQRLVRLVEHDTGQP